MARSMLESKDGFELLFEKWAGEQTQSINLRAKP